MSPRRPLKPCSYRGCPGLTDGRYCVQHQHLSRQARRQYDQQRGSAAKRGYGHKWRVYCEEFLREHPWCMCGCGRPSTDVDHIVPVSGPDDPLFWEPSNHQALAHECHSRKTAKYDGRWGR